MIRAPVAIVAAGAWARPLLEAAGVDLRCGRRSSSRRTSTRTRDDLPTVIDWDAPPTNLRTSCPTRSGPGDQGRRAPVRTGVDPDARTFEADEAREQRVVDWVGDRLARRRRAPDGDVPVHVTPDEDFVLDRVGPLVIASPCSGHGFKFTPLIGEVLADLATGEAPQVPLDRFRADRPALRA